MKLGAYDYMKAVRGGKNAVLLKRMAEKVDMSQENASFASASAPRKSLDGIIGT